MDPRTKELELAIRTGNIDRINRAIDAGADVNAPIKDGIRPLMLSNIRPDVIRLLCDRGADPNLFEGNYLSPLMMATTFGNVDMVRALCECGANVNAVTKKYTPWEIDGMTALMFACEDGDKAEAAAVLCENGADVNARNNYGKTALMYSAEKGDAQMLSMLHLKWGADVNAADKEGKTVFMYARDNNIRKLLSGYISKLGGARKNIRNRRSRKHSKKSRRKSRKSSRRS